MIDLCYRCIEAVNDPRVPVFDASSGNAVNFITVTQARKMMATEAPSPYTVGPTGETLPMLAVATVEGSRVCAAHVAHITAEAIRARLRGR